MVNYTDVHVRKIEISEIDVLKKILDIHDEIPRAWDSSHKISAEYRAKTLIGIQTSHDPQGFWIITKTNGDPTAMIAGLLWATLKRNLMDDSMFCCINSFWIHPDIRNRNLTPLLTGELLEWTKESKVFRLECSTHFANSRMREILEKNGFKQGMLQYSREIKS